MFCLLENNKDKEIVKKNPTPAWRGILLFAAHNVGGFASAGASGTAQHPLENPMKSENEGNGIGSLSFRIRMGFGVISGDGKCFLGGKFRVYGTNRQNLSHASPKKEGSDGESLQVGNCQESDSRVVLVTLLGTVMGCYLRVHVLKA